MSLTRTRNGIRMTYRLTAAHMIPVGYMAKRIKRHPARLRGAGVDDVYSVSACMSANFTENTTHWKHNAYSFLDSPGVVREIAASQAIDMSGVKLFYYEMSELEFHEIEQEWRPISDQSDTRAQVIEPVEKYLEGYDVVTYSAGVAPECSPLSCNSLAVEIPTNRHCLLTSFESAEQALENGLFLHSEPGPYRIFAVYSV